jgi:F1F0 ATPase subunit 2
MDAERMSAASIDGMPAWAVFAFLGVHLGVGVMLGACYFRTLWWTAARFALGGHVATTITLMIGRFAVLAGLLLLASLEGARPLLMTALGILIARSEVVHRVGIAAP